MCSSPKIPGIPERQTAKSPDSADAMSRGDERIRRRMAMAAMLTRGAGGFGSPPRVTTPGMTPPKMTMGA
jgi:hypothetical protein